MMDHILQYEGIERYMADAINHTLEELKDVNNEYQQLIGNIRVNVRIRPFIENDRPSDKLTSTVKCLSRTELLLKKPADIIKSDNYTQEYHFNFERVYSSMSTQDNLFTELSSLIQSSIDGFNVCIFSYGQTGAGKTYTMLGGEEPGSKGLLPRTVEMLFDRAKGLEQVGFKCNFSVCFCEIYNNKMVDLLDDKRTEISELVTSNLN